MRHLIIDGMNFAWRSKVWGQDNAVGYVFFRNLRALVELHRPDRVWYVLEGYPKARHALSSEYKANRILAEDDPKLQERRDFNEQIYEARQMMAQKLPVSTLRHPDWECDDTIYNLVKKASSEPDADIIVSSSDSDFVQLIQEFPDVRLWNHTRKSFVQSPDYDYVTWKALRGDGSDNIKGIKGVGDKTAASLVKDQDRLIEFLSDDESRRLTFERNVELIRFHEFDEVERRQIEHSHGSLDAEALKMWFASIDAVSMIEEPYWTRFCETFRRLR